MKNWIKVNMRSVKFKTMLLILLPITSLFGSVKIETNIDKSQIYIGDRINYTIYISYPKGYQILKPPLASNLGQFEIKDFVIGKPVKKDSLETQTYTFNISTYDTGTYVIPPTGIAYKDLSGKEGVLLTQPTTIKVLSLLSGPSENWKLKDIKPPLKYPFPIKTFLMILIPVLLFASAIILWIFYRKRKGLKTFLLSSPPKPAYEIALERLSSIQSPDDDDPIAVKSYHIDVTEIIREYIENGINVPALELITSEIIDGINGKVSQSSLSILENVLNLSDMVKFAKFMPTHNENVNLLEKSKTFVQETMPVKEYSSDKEVSIQ